MLYGNAISTTQTQVKHPGSFDTYCIILRFEFEPGELYALNWNKRTEQTHRQIRQLAIVRVVSFSVNGRLKNAQQKAHRAIDILAALILHR